MSAFASSSRMALSLPSTRLYPLARRYATAPTTEMPAVRRRGRPATSDVDLVAPPDPLSNIRPVIYASKSTRPTSKSSPYSTGEFPYSEGDASLQDLELEWRLRRERVDVANHRFWSSINSEFNAHLANRLAALPPASTPPTEQDEQLRENVLNQFYADWQIANRDRQARWVKEWWRECWAGLRMQGKVYMARLFRR